MALWKWSLVELSRANLPGVGLLRPGWKGWRKGSKTSITPSHCLFRKKTQVQNYSPEPFSPVLLGRASFFSARLRNVFSPHFGKPGYRRHETGGIAAWGVYETRLWAAMKLKSLNTYIVHSEKVEKPKSTDGKAKAKPRSRPTDFHTQFANYTDTDYTLNKHINRWMIQCLHGTTWLFSPLWLAFWETEASCDCNGGF